MITYLQNQIFIVLRLQLTDEVLDLDRSMSYKKLL